MAPSDARSMSNVWRTTLSSSLKESAWFRRTSRCRWTITIPWLWCCAGSGSIGSNVGLVQTSREPYPLLIVRPHGEDAFSICRHALEDWDDDFGYELLPEGIEVAYPEPDVNLRDLLQRAIDEARWRQSQRLARRPQGIVLSTTSRQGGFVRDGQPAFAHARIRPQPATHSVPIDPLVTEHPKLDSQGPEISYPLIQTHSRTHLGHSAVTLPHPRQVRHPAVGTLKPGRTASLRPVAGLRHPGTERGRGIRVRKALVLPAAIGRRHSPLRRRPRRRNFRPRSTRRHSTRRHRARRHSTRPHNPTRAGVGPFREINFLGLRRPRPECLACRPRRRKERLREPAPARPCKCPASRGRKERTGRCPESPLAQLASSGP